MDCIKNVICVKLWNASLDNICIFWHPFICFKIFSWKIVSSFFGILDYSLKLSWTPKPSKVVAFVADLHKIIQLAIIILRLFSPRLVSSLTDDGRRVVVPFLSVYEVSQLNISQSLYLAGIWMQPNVISYFQLKLYSGIIIFFYDT